VRIGTNGGYLKTSLTKEIVTLAAGDWIHQ